MLAQSEEQQPSRPTGLGLRKSKGFQMWIEKAAAETERDRGKGGEDLVLHLQTKEVALLLDILEAALPTEKISGLHTCNPAMTHFFNSVYGGLLSTAREQGWGGT
jgi:hypothetical protein